MMREHEHEEFGVERGRAGELPLSFWSEAGGGGVDFGLRPAFP